MLNMKNETVSVFVGVIEEQWFLGLSAGAGVLVLSFVIAAQEGLLTDRGEINFMLSNKLRFSLVSLQHLNHCQYFFCIHNCLFDMPLIRELLLKALIAY